MKPTEEEKDVSRITIDCHARKSLWKRLHLAMVTITFDQEKEYYTLGDSERRQSDKNIYLAKMEELSKLCEARSIKVLGPTGHFLTPDQKARRERYSLSLRVQGESKNINLLEYDHPKDDVGITLAYECQLADQTEVDALVDALTDELLATARSRALSACKVNGARLGDLHKSNVNLNVDDNMRSDEVNIHVNLNAIYNLN